nr:MAG TPA: DNA gyrase subunit A [Caudoviricetes sp.]
MNVECVVCGKKFFTNYKNGVVCSEKCRKKYHDMYEC